MSKCKSKNTCSKKDCSAKHHTTLIQIFHEYFTSNQTNGSKKRRKEDPKQNLSIRRMQILPVKVKTIGGRTTTYALVNNGSQITLIRDGFVQGLKLKGYKKTISISSVIDEVEEVKDRWNRRSQSERSLSENPRYERGKWIAHFSINIT